MRALRAYRARVLYIYIYMLLCLLLFGASGSGFFGVIEDSNRANERTLAHRAPSNPPFHRRGESLQSPRTPFPQK